MSNIKNEEISCELERHGGIQGNDSESVETLPSHSAEYSSDA